MQNLLLVLYTPRHDSNTQKLVNTFLSAAQDHYNIKQIDLAKNPPPLLSEDNLNALLKRNFMGIDLTEDEQATVACADQYTEQLMEADKIVIAFPMYNFSLPAAIKAWIDLVTQKDKTFAISEMGEYSGLLSGKHALTLMTTGNDFNLDVLKDKNLATPLIQQCFDFIGVSNKHISAFGLNQYADRAGQIVEEAQQKILDFLEENSNWNTAL